MGARAGVSVRVGRNRGDCKPLRPLCGGTADESLDIGARLTWDHVPAVPLTERVRLGHIYTTSLSLSFSFVKWE